MSDLGIRTTVSSEGHRKKRPRRLRGCFAGLIAFAIVVALGAVVYVKGVDAIRGWISGPADYQGNGHGSVIVRVRPGDTASDIAATLVKAHVVESEQAFTDAARDNARSRTIEVGYYRMRLQMSGSAALALMLQPSSRVDTTLTIPEGMRADEIVASIAAHTAISKAKLQAALADPKALGLPSYANGDVEGYLYPATYTITPGTTAIGLLRSMVARFNQEAAQIHLAQGAKALHMTPGQIVNVASLVQAEASRPQDMPKVARVVDNRLKAPMMLQFDSTLHYAVDSRGVVATSKKLRELKTPYNTYIHYGLPPTPIDSPGEASLEAALHPTPGSWLYFVTVNLATGETKFATTFAQQEANEQLYHEYCEHSSRC